MATPQPSPAGRLQAPPASDLIPSSLTRPGAFRFWLAIFLTAVSTGLGAAALTKLLEAVQATVWHGSGTNILQAAQSAAARTHVEVLFGAAILTGVGQILLTQLSSGNGIDTTAAIWFYGGRLPTLRTLGSAVISVLIVGMGVSLGREGAPKQAGAVFANFFSDRERLSEEQRRLLVACGAGAGLGAAYGVPLGGALFSLEVMRGKLALRYVLPALFASLVATGISWLFLPNAPTYVIPSYSNSVSLMLWTLVAGPILGFGSVAYVRMITWAYRRRPTGWKRLFAPAVIIGLLGVVSIRFPQILGNGKDISQLAFTGAVAPTLLLALLFLKPGATVMCVRSGAPGGLFTPSLTAGALLGGVLGSIWSLFSPGIPVGVFSLLGAGAMIAATTQGPFSAVVLMMELTGRDRSFILPLLLVVGVATLISRTIEIRSIYDARLNDKELAERQRRRDQPEG